MYLTCPPFISFSLPLCPQATSSWSARLFFFFFKSVPIIFCSWKKTSCRGLEVISHSHLCFLIEPLKGHILSVADLYFNPSVHQNMFSVARLFFQKRKRLVLHQKLVWDDDSDTLTKKWSRAFKVMWSLIIWNFGHIWETYKRCRGFHVVCTELSCWGQYCTSFLASKISFTTLLAKLWASSCHFSTTVQQLSLTITMETCLLAFNILQ